MYACYILYVCNIDTACVPWEYNVFRVHSLCWHTVLLGIVCVPRKEGNVLFNNALDTFYLLLYGVGHFGKGPLR